MQIHRQLQVVAGASPDGAQEFFICKKIKENPFLRKFASSTFAAQVAESKPARIMPRACKSIGSCKWLQAHLPMEHRNFSYARKSKKIHFCENLHLRRLQRKLLNQNPLESCREHANPSAVASGCRRISRWSTGIFRMQENQRKSISAKICIFDVC